MMKRLAKDRSLISPNQESEKNRMKVTSNPLQLTGQWQNLFSGRMQPTGKEANGSRNAIFTAVAGREAVYYDKSELEGKSLIELNKQGYFDKLERSVKYTLGQIENKDEYNKKGVEIFQNLGLIKPEPLHPYLLGNFKNRSEQITLERDYWRSKGFENSAPDPNRPLDEQLKEIEAKKALATASQGVDATPTLEPSRSSGDIITAPTFTTSTIHEAAPKEPPLDRTLLFKEATKAQWAKMLEAYNLFTDNGPNDKALTERTA
jgi:hypothetical protein